MAENAYLEQIGAIEFYLKNSYPKHYKKVEENKAEIEKNRKRKQERIRIVDAITVCEKEVEEYDSLNSIISMTLGTEENDNPAKEKLIKNEKALDAVDKENAKYDQWCKTAFDFADTKEFTGKEFVDFCDLYDRACIKRENPDSVLSKYSFFSYKSPIMLAAIAALEISARNKQARLGADVIKGKCVFDALKSIEGGKNEFLNRLANEVAENILIAFAKSSTPDELTKDKGFTALDSALAKSGRKLDYSRYIPKYIDVVNRLKKGEKSIDLVIDAFKAMCTEDYHPNDEEGKKIVAMLNSELNNPGSLEKVMRYAQIGRGYSQIVATDYTNLRGKEDMYGVVCTSVFREYVKRIWKDKEFLKEFKYYKKAFLNKNHRWSMDTSGNPEDWERRIAVYSFVRAINAYDIKGKKQEKEKDFDKLLKCAKDCLKESDFFATAIGGQSNKFPYVVDASDIGKRREKDDARTGRLVLVVGALIIGALALVPAVASRISERVESNQALEVGDATAINAHYLNENLILGDETWGEKIIAITNFVKRDAKKGLSSGDYENVENPSNFEYSVRDKNNIRIDKVKSFDTEVEIPAYIDGLPVLEIGSEAMRENHYVESVKIPWTVITIGQNAFYECERLKSVTVEDGYLINIGSGAFSQCISLESFTSNGIVRTIDSRAFLGCSSLKYVDINSDVHKDAYVNDRAFENDNSLEWVHLPKGLEYISGNVFQNCESLYSVRNDDIKATDKSSEYAGEVWLDVESIGNGAFENDKEIKRLTLTEKNLTIGNSAFENSGIEEISLSYNTGNIWGTINNAAFKGTNLKTVELPGSYMTVNGEVFADCTELETFIYHRYAQDEVAQRVYMTAFDNTPKLKDIYIPITAEVPNYRYEEFWKREDEITVHTRNVTFKEDCENAGYTVVDWDE